MIKNNVDNPKNSVSNYKYLSLKVKEWNEKISKGLVIVLVN